MPILTLIIVLVLIGVVLWLVNRYIPMDGNVKKILNIAVLIAVILWLLNVFGILGDLRSANTGHI